MKKLITVIACTCCLFALLIVSAFADTETLGLEIKKSGNMYFTYEGSTRYGVVSYSKSNFTLTPFASMDYSVVDLDFSSLDEKRNSYVADDVEVNRFTMLSLRYYLTSAATSFEGKTLQYRIVLDYDPYDTYDSCATKAERDFYATKGIGLHSDDVTSTMPNYASLYCPDNGKNYSLSSIGATYAFGGTRYDEFVITGSTSDVSVISMLLNGGFNVFYFPFIAEDQYLRISSSFVLVDTADITPSSSSGTSPDLTNPVIYDFTYNQKFKTAGDVYGPLSSVSTVSFSRPSSSASVSVLDVSDYLIVSRLPLMPQKYPLLLGVGLSDDSRESVFLSSNIVQMTLPLTFSRSYSPTSVDDGMPLFDPNKKYGYHMDIYFDFKNSAFNDYYDLVQYLNTNIYSYEPFSISFGSLTIPFEYFDVEYGYDYHTCRVTLDLDPDIEVERAFISAIQAYRDGDATLKISLPNTCYDDTFIGIPVAGFYEKGSVVVPGGDTPSDTPATPSSGISQSDLDAAFNRGYNQGISDGSDKNYVYGFINGIFSGFNQFYKTVTQGISIGGITLSAVITSICIIGLFVIVLKKVT